MQPWLEKNVRTGDLVSDSAGERGSGRIAAVHSYGCDIDFSAGRSFLGFGWIEKDSDDLSDIPSI